MILETLIATVGGTIAEAIFSAWIKENPVTVTIAEVIEKRTEDILLARRIQRQFDELGDKIALSLKPVFDSYDTKDSTVSIAFGVVAQEINAAVKSAKISSALLADLNHNPVGLANHIRKSHSISQLTFSEPEQALYERSIDLAAQYILDLSSNLPDFTRENFVEILDRIDISLSKLDTILAEIQHLRQISGAEQRQSYAEFEEDYRKTVIRRLDKIRIFGIDVAREVQRYNLTVAYVSLEVFQEFPQTEILPIIDSGSNTKLDTDTLLNDLSFMLKDKNFTVQQIVSTGTMSMIFDYSLKVGKRIRKARGILLYDYNYEGYHVFAIESHGDDYVNLFNIVMNTLQIGDSRLLEVATPQSEAIYDLQLYEDENGHFTIQYPANWKKEPEYDEDWSRHLYNKYKTKSLAIYSIGYSLIEESKYEGSDEVEFPSTSYVPNKAYKISVEEALDRTQRAAIIGEAGSGKTTLLQWLAVTSANNNFAHNLKSLENTVPFFIALRNYRDNPPQIEDFIKQMESDIPSQKPDRWVHQTLSSGRGLVLIDGLDEVLPVKRQAILDWIEDIVRQYPRVRIVFTSRPAAYKRGWLDGVEFQEFILSPMEYSSIKLFVQYWHRAVLIGHDIEKEDNVRIATNRLLDRLRNNIPLMRLATNPLLCAMICALHFDRRMQLPSDRLTLYEACISGLLERRDPEREIMIDHFPQMRYQEKRALLNDLAYWALKNGYTSFSSSEAKARIGMKMGNMQIATRGSDADFILGYLIERSGILREVSLGTIDFVHRTFQEYMAASAASLENDWGLLIQHASDDQWQETIILAAGFGNKTQASALISNILDKTKNANEKKKYYLQLLAIACLESATEISPEVRKRVEGVLHILIPPQDEFASINYLAAAGDLAVPYLSYDPSYSEKETSNCIAVLGSIGTRSALTKISEYLDDRRPKVVQALNRVFQIFTTESITSAGLADNLLIALRHYVSDNTIEISGNYLYAISGLSLDTLAQHFPLKLSKLFIYDFIPSNSYIFPLFVSIDQLVIDGNLVEGDLEIDFYSLRNANLQSIALIGSEEGWPSFEQISDMIHLKEFAIRIDNHIPDLRFLSYLTNVSKVTVFANFLAEIPLLETLAHLENLRHLHLGGRNLSDLTQFSKLDRVQILELSIYSKHVPEIIYGIEDFENLKKIIINTNTITRSVNKLAKELRSGFLWCNVEIRSPINFSR